jgi:hypothetical protein
MNIEVLLLTWYVGVGAILGGLTVPLGPFRPWAFRLGVAVITASAAAMAYEYVVLQN